MQKKFGRKYLLKAASYLDEKKPLKIINLTLITVSLEVIMELKKLDYAT